MRTLVMSVIFALLALTSAACEKGSTPGDEPSATATSTSSATPTDDLLLSPGKAGPFTIGMTAKEALAQGLVREPNEHECGLTPVDRFKDLSLQFADSEKGDVLFGVLIKDASARTTEGVGVGDSIDKVKTTYGSKLTKTTGEYGETRYVIADGDRAIGFTDLEGEVASIDVFQTDSPVIWDGC